MGEDNKYGENEIETEKFTGEQVEPLNVEQGYGVQSENEYEEKSKSEYKADSDKENQEKVNDIEPNHEMHINLDIEPNVGVNKTEGDWTKQNAQDGIYRLNRGDIPRDREENRDAAPPYPAQGAGQTFGGYQQENYRNHGNYQNQQNIQDQGNYQNQQNTQNQGNYQNQQNAPYQQDFQNRQNTQGQQNYQNQQGYYSGGGYGGYSEKEPKEPLFTKKFWKKIIAAGVIAAVFGVTVGIGIQGGSYLLDRNEKKQEEQKEKEKLTAGQTQGTLKTTDVGNVITRSAEDVSTIVSNVQPSIVAITNVSVQKVQTFLGAYDEEVPGSGSGIIIGKNDKELLVATNNHVIANSKEITVTFNDEKSVTAEVKGTDSVADLAVVAIKLSDMEASTLKNIKIAALGNSDQVKVGEMAVAIGNALGYGQSVTVGYISAKDRVITENKMTLLQTDAAINPGNSGGALLNMKGEVIGINSIKFTDNMVEGMGYAIPMSKATPIINELMKKEVIPEGEQGVLNIAGNTVEEVAHTNYGVPMGALVSTVTPNGAADKAGMLVGDIITKVNGIETESFDSMAEKVKSNKAGTKIKVTVQRRTNTAYEEKILEVTLDKAAPVEIPDSPSIIEGGDQGTNPYPGVPNDGSNGSIEDFFRFFQ